MLWRRRSRHSGGLSWDLISLSKMDRESSVWAGFCFRKGRLHLLFGLSLTKVTLYSLIGVLNRFKLLTMHQRLLSTSNLPMTVRKSTGLDLLLRDHHFIQIFFWPFIISTLLSGRRILRDMRSPYLSRWTHKELTTPVVPSLQPVLASFSLPKQMESMYGTS